MTYDYEKDTLRHERDALRSEVEALRTARVAAINVALEVDANERDTARSEVEALRTALAACVDAWDAPESPHWNVGVADAANAARDVLAAGGDSPTPEPEACTDWRCPTCNELREAPDGLA